MALPADVLAAVTKANAVFAQTEKLWRIAAEQQAQLAKQQQLLAHVAQLAPQLERAWPTLERTGKARQVLAETQKLRQMIVAQHGRMAQGIKVVQLAVIRGRASGSRSECSGARTRASRGKPIRRRGSRRTPAATRAGPDDGAGDSEPGPKGSGHLDRYALAGSPA